MKKRGMKVIGFMIGDTVTEADKEYKKAIDDYIHENELINDIYAPGFRRDIDDILAATDCVLVPSSEGMPLAVLEAMSAQKRITGMDSGGTRELLEKAGCGVTYPSNGVPVQIVDAIIKARKESCESLERGYNFCQNQTPDKYKEKLHRIFGL